MIRTALVRLFNNGLKQQTTRQLGLIDGTNKEELAQMAQDLVAASKQERAIKAAANAKRNAMSSEARSLRDAVQEFKTSVEAEPEDRVVRFFERLEQREREIYTNVRK